MFNISEKNEHCLVISNTAHKTFACLSVCLCSSLQGWHRTAAATIEVMSRNESDLRIGEFVLYDILFWQSLSKISGKSRTFQAKMMRPRKWITL